jgi:hypothetical protein
MACELDKTPAILSVLDRLRSRLGPDAFILADHWENDLCAIGIASPRDPRVLVYISTYTELPDRFGYELEMPQLGSDAPYQATGRGTNVSFEELVGVIIEHLKRA